MAYRSSSDDAQEGIYRDDRAHIAHKWSAVVLIPDLASYRKLGPFQTELDATAALNRAKQEVMATGTYTGRWAKPRQPEPPLTLHLSPSKEKENYVPEK